MRGLSAFSLTTSAADGGAGYRSHTRHNRRNFYNSVSRRNNGVGGNSHHHSHRSSDNEDSRRPEAASLNRCQSQTHDGDDDRSELE